MVGYAYCVLTQGGLFWTKFVFDKNKSGNLICLFLGQISTMKISRCWLTISECKKTHKVENKICHY